MTEHPIQEEKYSIKSLAQKAQDTIHRIHQKIGVYGWIALALFIILLCTRCDHDDRGGYYRHSRMPHPMYMEQGNNWRGSIGRDFENMNRDMQNMRMRQDRMTRDIFVQPGVPSLDTGVTTSVVLNGSSQYSVTTKDGKLDGFVSVADSAKVELLLAQIKGLGLAVEQKDGKIFFNGDAQRLNDLLKVLGK